MSNLTNPEAMRAMTPSERAEAATRISELVEALRAFRWIAQAMTPAGCEGPAPDPACDLPNGAGPDWSALVTRAEDAIADATTGGLESLFPLRMIRGGASVMAGDAIAAESYLDQGFRVPVLSPAANFFPSAVDPIPSDPTSPEYFAWSVRRAVRDGDVGAAISQVARLRDEAQTSKARALAASNALIDSIGQN
jgi:hypothetical protein